MKYLCNSFKLNVPSPGVSHFYTLSLAQLHVLAGNVGLLCSCAHTICERPTQFFFNICVFNWNYAPSTRNFGLLCLAEASLNKKRPYSPCHARED